ncbi:AAA family ATPase [Patescibacteria group bacterium]|nr:AAA family ATPase [Patescibacteria group bacterium]
MYLKKIEISGFKSFAHKTTLEFEKGISAVVGPNGSGKSNIADAVRWAIGEQSIKALRAKKSENLIYAGSHSGHSSSRAAVSLFFDNSDRLFFIDFEEIVVSRRVYKSGENEYFINDSKARLIDVLELLARAGINPKSYCVVNQGMTDAILKASPEERRSIFEDATGVKPYKIKKNEAARKLDLTSQNLLRVKDLLVEISPRLAFLKRQANKLQKFEIVKQQLEDNQKQWYSCNLNKFSEQKNGLRARIEAIESGLKKSENELGGWLEKMEAIKNQSFKIDDLEEKLKAEMEDIQAKINDCTRKLAICETKLAMEKEKQKREEESAKTEPSPINADYIRDRISDIYQKIQAAISGLDGKTANLASIDAAKDKLKNIERKIKNLLEEIVIGKIMAIKKNSQGKTISDPPARLAVSLAESRREAAAKRAGGSEKELEKEIVKIKADFSEMESQKSILGAKIKKETADDKSRRGDFFSLQEKINLCELSLGKIKGEREQMMIEKTKIDTRLEVLILEIKKDIPNIDIESIEKLNIRHIDEADIKSKIDRLKYDMVQIGGIDPAIIKEFKETDERYAFLAKESEDLERAIADLEKIIDQLDQKIEEQFNSIFKKINFEFNKYFRQIFGGGGASLEIFDLDKNGGEKDEEDEDTSAKSKKREKGIAVKILIPGKKIKDMEMLSGGERALTSVAILFAIISSNPPPFVILDEVDAALDESNSQKIAKILNQLSAQTQFVVITHNRAIMRESRVIFGVSMTDESVSKIISVKFDGAE